MEYQFLGYDQIPGRPIFKDNHFHKAGDDEVAERTAAVADGRLWNTPALRNHSKRRHPRLEAKRRSNAPLGRRLWSWLWPAGKPVRPTVQSLRDAEAVNEAVEQIMMDDDNESNAQDRATKQHGTLSADDWKKRPSYVIRSKL